VVGLVSSPVRFPHGTEFRAVVVGARRFGESPSQSDQPVLHPMVPPCFASGAGAEMRRSVGTATLWGAFGVTLFGIFLTPVFFFVIRRLVRGERRPAMRPPSRPTEWPRHTGHRRLFSLLPRTGSTEAECAGGEPGSRCLLAASETIMVSLSRYLVINR
jgi:hypothetical protein